MANINGWGRGTWGQLTWGEPLPVTLTAPSAATSALGTISVVAKANITPTGQSATGGISGVGVNGDAVAVCPTAVGTLGSVSVLVDGEANVYPSGQAGTSALGTISLVTNNNISVTLGTATGSVGSVTINAKANVSITGQSATGNVGKVLVWSMIDESQTSNFDNITETQTPSWKDVAA